MKNNNLITVHICNHAGEHIETLDLRINRKKFHPGVKFEAMRNKASLVIVRLEYVKHDADGSIIAKKCKK